MFQAELECRRHDAEPLGSGCSPRLGARAGANGPHSALGPRCRGLSARLSARGHRLSLRLSAVPPKRGGRAARGGPGPCLGLGFKIQRTHHRLQDTPASTHPREDGFFGDRGLGIGDWRLGIGGWRLGMGDYKKFGRGARLARVLVVSSTRGERRARGARRVGAGGETERKEFFLSLFSFSFCLSSSDAQPENGHEQHEREREHEQHDRQPEHERARVVSAE